MSDSGKFRILFIAGAGVGAKMLGKILEERGHKVHVQSPSTVMKKNQSGFDFILATTYSDQERILDLEKSFGAARRHSPEATVILGGPGFTEQPEAFIRYFQAKYGLMGEADHTIEELFELFERHGLSPAWSKVKQIQGAVYRAGNNRVYANNELPKLRAEEIRWDYAPVCKNRRENRVNIHVNRGCPNHCYFCSKWFGDRVRTAPLDYVIGLIEKHAANPTVDEIGFMGELFLPRHKALALCKMIIEREINCKVSFSADFTVGSLTTPEGDPDVELIDALQESGFIHMGIGIESFQQNILDELGKPHKAQDAMRLIRYLYSRYLSGHFYTISRTVESTPLDCFMDSYNTVIFATNDFVRWFPSGGRLYLFPGTELFRRHKQDPKRFRDLLNPDKARLVHPFADLDALAKRRILICEGVPRDPLVDVAGSLDSLLYGMEERRDYLSKDNKREVEQQLCRMRKIMKKLPSAFVQKGLDVVTGLHFRMAVEIVTGKGFVRRWRISQGRKGHLVELRLKKCLAKEAQVDGAAVPELHTNALMLHILNETIEKEKDRLLPRSEMKRLIERWYDELIRGKADLAYLVEIPGLMSDLSAHLYAQSITEAMKLIGKTKFTGRLMKGKDPLLQFAMFLALNQFNTPEWEEHVRWRNIKAGEDSRPYLIATKEILRAARTLPDTTWPIP